MVNKSKRSVLLKILGVLLSVGIASPSSFADNAWRTPEAKRAVHRKAPPQGRRPASSIRRAVKNPLVRLGEYSSYRLSPGYDQPQTEYASDDRVFGIPFVRIGQLEPRSYQMNSGMVQVPRNSQRY